MLNGILAGLEDGEILLETAEGIRRIARKAASLVKPVVDMEGIEDVDLGGEGPENETQATDNATEEKRSKE